MKLLLASLVVCSSYLVVDASPRASVKLTFGEIDARLEKRKVTRAITAAIPAFQHCYDQATRAVAGTVSVRITVDAKGIASDIRTDGLAGVDQCIALDASKIVLPLPATGLATVRFTLDFTPVATAAPAPDGPRVVVDKVSGLDAKGASLVLESAQPAFGACYTKTASRDTMRATITTNHDGAVTDVLASGPDEAIACITAAAKKLAFPRATTSTATASIRLVFDEPAASIGILGGTGGPAFTSLTGMGDVNSGQFGGYHHGTGDRPPSPAPRLEVTKATGVDRAAVRRVLLREIQTYLYCYDRELGADTSMQGTVTTTLDVAADGTVKKATANGFDRNVDSCVRDVSRRLALPRTKGAGSVTFTLAFTSGAPAVPRMDFAVLETDRTEAAPAIRRQWKRQQARLLYCYEAEARNGSPATGTLTATFTVDAAGTVSSIRTKGLDKKPKVGTCVANLIRGTEFPKQPAGPVKVQATLQFRLDSK